MIPIGQIAANSRADGKASPLEQIVVVQWLRGIAASMVVAYHLIERYQRRNAFPHDAPAWIDRLGEVGVLVFFAISGFIMVYTSAGVRSGHDGAAAFLRNRLTRVIPLYYLTTLLIVGFRLATERMSTKPFVWPAPTEWITSFLFIPYRNGEGDFQPIYKLGWTLNYEIAFYLLFAFAILLARRRAGYLAAVLLTMIVLVGCFIPEPRDNGLTLVIYFLSRPILLYFVVGILLAIALPILRPRCPVVHPITLCGLVSIAVFLAVVDDAARSLLWVGVALMAATGIRGRWTVLPRFSRLADAFGNASYAIYLTHSFVLGAYAAITARWMSGVYGAAGLITGGCLMCFAVGWLTWYWVERPMTSRLRTMMVRKTVNAAL